MPLQKFEDMDAARRAMWTSADDPHLAKRIRTLWERARRLAPSGPGTPRGVRRFRSIVEANEERNTWIRRRVQAIREVRDRG